MALKVELKPTCKYHTCFSALTVLHTNKYISNASRPNYDKIVDAGILANVAALAIVIMLAHVLYISVNPFFEWDVVSI